MLRSGAVYFASDLELNDASECRPRFILRGSEELWQRLARYILENLCFASDRLPSENQSDFQKVVDLSDAIGRQLKASSGNQDFPIEGLGEAFQMALTSCGAGNLSPPLLRTIKALAGNFFEHGLGRTLAERKYIASFALDATNPTMWGHYADAERGFVRVFETRDDTVQVYSDLCILHGSRESKDREGITEIGIYKDAILKLNALKYAKKPPKVNAFHRLIPKFSYSEQEHHYDVPLMLCGDAIQKKEDLVGLIKYSDWRYEKEVRAFLPAHDRLLPEARVLRVSRQNLRGLVFGPRMSDEDKSRAVLNCHIMQQSRHAEVLPGSAFTFFQATQSSTEFGFSIHPIGILDGQYHGGRLPLKMIRELDESITATLYAMANLIAKNEKLHRAKRHAANADGVDPEPSES